MKNLGLDVVLVRIPRAGVVAEGDEDVTSDDSSGEEVRLNPKGLVYKRRADVRPVELEKKETRGIRNTVVANDVSNHSAYRQVQKTDSP